MRTTYVQRRERRRLGQLGVCVILFAATIIGRGLFPMGWSGETADTNRLLSVQEEVDAFSSLGSSVFENQSVWNAFEHLVVTVFGGADDATVSAEVPDSGSAAYQAAKQTLSAENNSETFETQLSLPYTASQTQTAETQTQAADTADAQQSQDVVQAVAQTYDDAGEALPPNVSMQYYNLGLSNTVTPVNGTVSSTFGYRTHPVSGVYRFHFGTDIAADTGTTIEAFADGVVEYVGESSEYGLYVQLDHANNVKTFYCHCSELDVTQGETVTAGQKIAEVGSTGDSTGPHLHFEVKKDGIYLNSIYYVNLS
ncbi:MAG: peptidase [Oscillospiraceae bacterium]|nr:peptidase [Oscillospiraceae bacterium]